MVSGIGYDRAASLGPPAARFHELRVVVTNLAVLDFATPDRGMRLRSVHPGVATGQIGAATGFELAVPDEVPVTREPTAEELALISGHDPRPGTGCADKELPVTLHTRLTDLLGVDYPVVQTGMGYVSGARLTAAISQAGGLGIIAIGDDELRRSLQRDQRRSGAGPTPRSASTCVPTRPTRASGPSC